MDGLTWICGNAVRKNTMYDFHHFVLTHFHSTKFGKITHVRSEIWYFWVIFFFLAFFLPNKSTKMAFFYALLNGCAKKSKQNWTFLK